MVYTPSKSYCFLVWILHLLFDSGHFILLRSMIQGVSTQYSSGRTLSFKAHCTLHCSFSHFEHFGNLSLEFQTDFQSLLFFLPY